MRETRSPSEPKAAFCILLYLTRGKLTNESRTLDLVWSGTRLFASAIFTAALAVAGVFFCIYALRTPGPPPHGLMNSEGIVALSFLALLFARRGSISKPQPFARVELLGLAVSAIVVALAFAPILRSQFLYDDYTHITDASHYTLRVAAQQFERVHWRGLFFRPVGFFLYWLNYLWAGANPVLWHASSIALHVISTCLVFALCRQLGIARQAGFAATLLFAFSGLMAEPVGWIDARFDPMATALVLASLLCINHGWLVSGLAVGACGMLCKESGFCLPLLILALALFRPRTEWPRIWRAAAWAGLVAAALFAYRWWALGGIGGYASAGGEAGIFRFNPLHTVDALLLRQWAILFFPFNWSAPSSSLLRAALAAIPLILAVCAWMAKPPRRALAGCIAFIIAAALPVQHLLLLGPDLSGSRQLYLASVGWALLWACVLDTIAWRPRVIIAGALVALEICVLEHNLNVWRDTAEAARSVCASFGKVAAETPDPIVVRSLPAFRMGTVYLNNGFPQCVEMNSGVAAARIHVARSDESTPNAQEFVWKETGLNPR